MKCDITKCKAWCCKGFYIEMKPEPELKRYLLKRYLEYHNCKFVGKRMIVPLRCKYLDENNKCKIYYSRLRPKMCKTEFCHDSLSLEEEAIKLEKLKEVKK